MYIPPFWCGVAAGIVGTLLVLTILCTLDNKKDE